jgi:hypothetical protein
MNFISDVFLDCFTWYATPALTAACAESTGGSSRTVINSSGSPYDQP